MSHTVRKHERKTKSGGTTTVRQHTRRGGGPKADRPGGAFGRIRGLLASRRAARRPADDLGWDDGDLAEDWTTWRDQPVPARRLGREVQPYPDSDRDPPGRDHPQTFGEAWSGSRREYRVKEKLRCMQIDMRAWRDAPEPTPGPQPPMTPELARVLGCDTPEGLAKFERGRAYREAGYRGPLDKNERIPDPDDPANYEMLHGLAALAETSQ
jgi:hypothetical protein